MKKMLGLLLILASLGFLGCAGFIWAPVVPPIGVAFTSINAPLDVDLNETEMGEREGRATCMNILGLFAFGDASVAAAARDGNIDIVMHADYTFLSVLGLFAQYTTIVYGE